MKCTLVYCETESNAYVEHYTPDALVTVYTGIGSSPEPVSGRITELLSRSLVQTSGAQKRPSADIIKTANHYRIADVYGSPAATALTELLGQVNTISACETSITPYEPYFVSSTNPFIWNSGFLDAIGSLKSSWDGGNIGERYDGQPKPSNVWGSANPRVGVVLNHDHFKASSVIAYRAMDIVFNGAYGMLNQKLGGETKPWYQPSHLINVHNTLEGKWQMLYPKNESSCHVIGDKTLKDKSGIDLEGWSGRRSNDGTYAFHYWRRYECCKQPDGYFFLFKTVW